MCFINEQSAYEASNERLKLCHTREVKNAKIKYFTRIKPSSKPVTAGPGVVQNFTAFAHLFLCFVLDV